jgi:hypothetical protein
MGVVMKEITAFPFVASDDTGMIINTGMTMRDYFAAKAIQAILPTYKDIFDDETQSEGGPSFPELLAKDAYIMADAMLKAREA